MEPPQPDLPSAPKALVKFCNLIFIGCAAGGLGLVLKGFAVRSVDPSWSDRLVQSGALAALLFLLPLALKIELRISAALTVLAAGIAAICANVYIGLQPADLSLNAKIDAARLASGQWDSRSTLEVVRARSEAGQPSVPAMLPCNVLPRLRPDQLVPLSGISTSTTVLCNELGKHAIYRSDRFGFNNPAELGPRSDIVLIGDSFTHGSCVPQGEDLASQLRKRGFSVANLGIAGSGPLIELATLMEFGLPRAPKLVIWIYVGNDLTNLTLEMDNPTLRRYLSEDGFTQSLRQKQDQVDTYWRGELANAMKALRTKKANKPKASPPPPRYTTRQLIALRPLRERLQFTRKNREPTDKTLVAIFQKAKRITEAQGAKLLVLTLPHWQLLSNFPDRKGSFPDVEKMLTAQKIEVFDFFLTIKNSPDPLSNFPFRLPAHYNVKGYRLLGDTIAKLLQEKYPQLPSARRR